MLGKYDIILIKMKQKYILSLCYIGSGVNVLLIEDLKISVGIKKSKTS